MGCSSADTDTPRTGAAREQDEAVANGSAGAGSAGAHGATGADDAGSGGDGGTAAANGKIQDPPRQEDESQEVFALSNTEDNDSIQGLVRSGGYLWIGNFRLPPAQPGEDESEVRK